MMETWYLYLAGFIAINVVVFLAASIVFTRFHTLDAMRVSFDLATMGAAVLRTDERGHIVQFNDVAEQLTGWPLKEALGKPASEVARIVSHDTRLPEEDMALKAINTGDIQELVNDTVLISRGGASEWPVDYRAAPIKGNDGRIKGALVIFRDISRRYAVEQRLVESEQRLRAVTEQARIGLVMIDRERRYVYANSFYLRLLGVYNSANVAGKRVEDVLPAKIYEQVNANLDKAFAGQRLSYEITGEEKNSQGASRRYSVTYEPQLRQSLVMHVIIVVVDITHIKGAQAQ